MLELIKLKQRVYFISRQLFFRGRVPLPFSFCPVWMFICRRSTGVCNERSDMLAKGKINIKDAQLIIKNCILRIQPVIIADDSMEVFVCCFGTLSNPKLSNLIKRG